MEIFKFQRSQFSSDGNTSILVYNENRSVMFEESIKPEDEKEMDKLFEEGERTYWYCTRNRDGGINPESPAPNQDW